MQFSVVVRRRKPRADGRPLVELRPKDDAARRPWCESQGVRPEHHCCLDMAFAISQPRLTPHQGPNRVVDWYEPHNVYRIPVPYDGTGTRLRSSGLARGAARGWANPRVVLRIDNPRWHRRRPIGEALRGCPHREFHRLPSDTPPRDPIERLGTTLRGRATHHRLLDTVAEFRRSVRSSESYDQTVRDRVRTRLDRKARERTPSPGS